MGHHGALTVALPGLIITIVVPVIMNVAFVMLSFTALYRREILGET